MQNHSKKFSILLFTLITVFTACQPGTQNELKPAAEGLQLDEGQIRRIGHYNATPDFSWRLPSLSGIDHQSAYQIQVASEPFETEPDLWDSGKVLSRENAWQRYGGTPLKSKQRAYWRVRYWDQDDRASAWSEQDFFELGLLNNRDWKGQWISIPDANEKDETEFQNTLYRPQYIREEFDITSPVEKARLYIASRGNFEAYINGQKIGNDRHTPGYTPKHKRIETLTYDVTANIASGKNAIGLILAEGWYAGRVFSLKKREVPEPHILIQLEIVQRDGTVKTLVTDENWRATRSGPLRFASHYDGEIYDAAMEIPGWSQPAFNDSQWQTVKLGGLDAGVSLQPKRHTAAKDIMSLSPQSIITAEPGRVVFDMGQNMVGVPQLKVPAKKSSEIKIRFAEALNKGEFYTKNYRSAHSTSYYRPAKDGVIEYQPRFTFHGFRYVELSGFDPNAKPELDWVKGIVQHSDFPVYSTFESSHEKLNQLFRNSEWGLRGNFLDIPTDCPQRDERMGWTGDAQVFAKTSMYLADVYAFWASWLQSVREDQHEDGAIPVVVPFAAFDQISPGWGDAATMIPWHLYHMTGDIAILEDNYDMMRRWVGYHQKRSTDLISEMRGFGDWLQPYPKKKGERGLTGDTHQRFIGTAFFAHSTYLTMRTARILNKPSEAQALETLLTEVKSAFRSFFFDDNLQMKVGHPTQTAYLLALAFDLLPEQEREMATQHLIKLIGEADNHLRTGFLGTPLLAPVLQGAGHSDLMYELLTKESYPSWFYSINNGATTLWERWNSYSLDAGFNPAPMNSLNHYAYGAVVEWFFEGILGITAASPGFKSLRIDPQIHPSLRYAKGTYASPYGNIGVDWRVEGGSYQLTVEVPPNTEAQVVLPSQNADTITINDKPLSDWLGQYPSAQFQKKEVGTGLLENLQTGRYTFKVESSSF